MHRITIKTEPVLNRSYRELARHYGFLIDPTPAYGPQKKGKVEAAVRYAKGNFMATVGDERDITVLNPMLDRWVVEVAGKRIHGTTRKRPLGIFEQIEKPAMRSLPSLRWRPISWLTPQVQRDILRKGLDLEPLPSLVVPKSGAMRLVDHGRAARLATEATQGPEFRRRSHGIRSHGGYAHCSLLTAHCSLLTAHCSLMRWSRCLASCQGS